MIGPPLWVDSIGIDAHDSLRGGRTDPNDGWKPSSWGRVGISKLGLFILVKSCIYIYAYMHIYIYIYCVGMCMQLIILSVTSNECAHYSCA